MGLEDSQICGLIGVAGNIDAKQEAVFKRLLEIDTIRGPHSTGVLAVGSQGGVDIVKAVGTPWNLYELKSFDEMMKGRLSVLMGHNRWATKGAVNRRNAHPFDHGHIIGAHNGTLRSQYLLPDHKDFEVDSDNIFHSIAKIGVDETIKRTCGAFALTWYDTEQETMNFIRNDERPLWLVESEDSKTVFWASEPWMLEVTLQLAGIKHKDLFQPKEGELYSYPIDLRYNPQAFPNVAVRNLELHKWPQVQPRYQQDNVTSIKKEVDGNKGKKIGPEVLIAEEKLEFFVASLKASSATGQQYVSCLPTMEDCDIELRLYTTDTNLIEQMVNSCNLFTGKVRGFTTYGGDSYCTLDPRTIIELEKPADADEDLEFALVYGNELVMEDEYDIAVSCGCGNCKTVPTIEESAELVWLDRLNFICGDCKDLPVVQDFIEKATKQSATKH